MFWAKVQTGCECNHLTLHGKAVVTRSVLRLVTEANADNERADAGYAASCGRASGTAATPAGGSYDERSRNDNVTARPGTVRPAGWDRESGFSVATREDTERSVGLWRRDSGERYPCGSSSSK